MSTTTVSNASQLRSAIESADRGDTILLEGGRYGSLNFSGASGLTIASANPGNPGTLDTTVVRDAKGLTFRDVAFKGDGNGLGLKIYESSDVKVLDSEFSGFQRATNFSNIDGLTISNNRVSSVREDGMTFGEVTNVQIVNNTFRNLNTDPGLKHKDIIQFWTSSSDGPSRNVTIRNNDLDSPDGLSHGIYFGNNMAGGGNKKYFYRDLVIENNDVHTSHAHGITVQDAIGVTIRNNSVTHNKSNGHTKEVNVPRIEVSSSSENVTISGNRSEGGSSRARSDDDARDTSQPDDRARAPESGTEEPETGARNDGPLEDAPGGEGGRSSGSTRFSGREAEGRRDIVDLDFGDGDTLVFNGYDSGTFEDKDGGNQLWNSPDGSYVRIDSALDLQELVEFSPGIRASVSGEDLRLTIAQDGGDHTVILEGMADEFRAADQPDLF